MATTRNSTIENDTLNQYAEKLEETAAMLLNIANRLREAARENWHPDYPSDDEDLVDIVTSDN